MEFASRGVGAAGLTTGIIGTAGVGLNLLSNLLMPNNCRNVNAGVNSDEHFVTQKESELSAKVAELTTEVKLRDANTFTMGEMGKLRDYFENKFAIVEKELCDQRVYNATNIASVNCIAGQVNQLFALTKLVIPNGSICPGWGNVTVTPATTTAG